MIKSKKFWIRIAGVITAIFFAVLIIYYDNKTSSTPFLSFDLSQIVSKSTLTLAETDVRMQIEAENNVSFSVMDKRILKCTRDGIKCYDSTGLELWNITFATTFPIMLTEQRISIVAERSGRNAYIFNSDGLLYSKELEFPIVSYRINSIGYSAIMTKSDVGYQIEIYDNKGTWLQTFVSEAEGIFPTAFDISDDGRIAAVNSLDINNYNMDSQVFFYYLTSEGADYPNYSYASSKRVKDRAVPLMSFMDNNRLITVSDNEIICMDEKPNELWKKQISNTIRHISFNSKKYIWVAFGEALTDEGKDYENTLVCWDLNGKELVKINTDQVTYLYTEGNIAVVGEVRKFYSVNTSSDVKWTKEFTQDVFQLIPLAKNFLFVGKDEANLMKHSTE